MRKNISYLEKGVVLCGANRRIRFSERRKTWERKLRKLNLSVSATHRKQPPLNGYVLTAVSAREPRSGTKVTHREEFQNMMRDCRLGKIDLILTKSVTRFARNTVDSTGELLITILSSQAQEEAIAANVNYNAGKERMQEMIEYLKSQPKRVAAYDEQPVRKLIEKITVYDDYLDYLFKLFFSCF